MYESRVMRCMDYYYTYYRYRHPAEYSIISPVGGNFQ
jgi:hypothetical protein